MSHDPIEMMTRQELAALLRVTPQALAHWRSCGAGPRSFKLGPHRTSKIRYRRVDVEAWLNSHGTGNGSPQPGTGLLPLPQQRVGTDSDGAVPSPTLYRSQEDVA